MGDAGLRCFPSVRGREVEGRPVFGVELRCGDRRIVVRAASGEVGPDGPFPMIELRGPEGDVEYPICRRVEFGTLFLFLQALSG